MFLTVPPALIVAAALVVGVVICAGVTLAFNHAMWQRHERKRARRAASRRGLVL